MYQTILSDRLSLELEQAKINVSPVENTGYKRRPLYFFNRHLETIVPSVFYSSPDFLYQRERLELKDGDFVDLDWLKKGNPKLAIISHGLEGSSDRYYIRRMAAFFHQNNWDICAWNTRGCSEEMNRLLVLNHHGFHSDLKEVVDHALSFDYPEIVLIGMSMGGNLSIKYLAEEEIDDRVLGAATFSVTGDMAKMTHALEKKSNWLYKKSFLKKMKEKILQLYHKHPGKFSIDALADVNTFEAFHQEFTVPLDRFESLDNFYWQASANHYIPHIKKPILMVNALNDPILSDSCYPHHLADQHKIFHLETPRYGGHLGFNYTGKPYSYMEIRALDFVENVLRK